jgi:leader peptidase (prepilin peptidase)/N-methyltransferase
VTHAAATVFAGLFGACIGSFLNVVIWRLPRGESLSKEGSHCPRCGTKIRWFDNVPVLGWLLLRGRCRACRGAISVRYPVVEALTATLFVLAALRTDPNEALGVVVGTCVALAALVAVAYIDHDERIIPRRIVLPMTVVGCAFALLVEGWAPATFLPALEKRHLAGLLRALLGAATGAGTILAIRVVGGAIAKKEVMGMGDVHLLGMVGAFTGPMETIYTLFLGSLTGATLGGLLVWARVRARVPIPVALGPAGAARSAPLPPPTPVPTRARAAATRLRARPAQVEFVLAADARVPVGAERDARLVFPAAAVWRDGKDPVEVDVRLRALDDGARGAQRYEVVASRSAAAEEGEDVVDTYAMFRKAVPFGVFLAIGAAVVVLYGAELARFVTETWPRIVTGGRV